jgi:hypothetical protein
MSDIQVVAYDNGLKKVNAGKFIGNISNITQNIEIFKNETEITLFVMYVIRKICNQTD